MLHSIYLAWWNCSCLSIRLGTDIAIIHAYMNIHAFRISIPINYISNIRVFKNPKLSPRDLQIPAMSEWSLRQTGTPYNSFQYQITTSLCSGEWNLLHICYNVIKIDRYTFQAVSTCQHTMYWWRNYGMKIRLRYNDLMGHYQWTLQTCGYSPQHHPFIHFLRFS